MNKSYRVHVHDNEAGRWLASADFRKRPASAEIAAAFPLLRVPGRYEVRVNVVDGDGDEHHLAGWLQDAAPERVIFRKFLDHREGDLGDGIIALFPDIPEDRPGMVLSYMHIGQHGAASMRLIGGEPRTTRPARPEEYADLKAELEAIPESYKLAVIQRTPKATNQPYNVQVRTVPPRCGERRHWADSEIPDDALDRALGSDT